MSDVIPLGQVPPKLGELLVVVNALA